MTSQQLAKVSSRLKCNTENIIISFGYSFFLGATLQVEEEEEEEEVEEEEVGGLLLKELIVGRVWECVQPRCVCPECVCVKPPPLLKRAGQQRRD